MSVADTEAVVRAFVADVWNGANPDAIDVLTTEGFVLHQLVADEDHDRAGFAAFQAGMREALPDFAVTVEAIVADGDAAFARVEISGTPERPFQALRPTGNSFSSPAFQQYRLEDGRIAEAWVMVDAIGTMTQLGLFPPSPATVVRMAVGTMKSRVLGD